MRLVALSISGRRLSCGHFVAKFLHLSLSRPPFLLIPFADLGRQILQNFEGPIHIGFLVKDFQVDRIMVQEA
jgi:hypothetical protein